MPDTATMVNGFDMETVDALDPELRQTVERRASLLGPAYKLFYRHPVRVVRAEGVHLFDADGQAYLDAYNNVPSVGHCHPRVVEAIARRAATLNTHTRYASELILDYAERLLATYLFSSDGIQPDPAGCLKPLLAAVHQADGLYIADEVQPGFGRTGDAMWGFQRHGIVPDLAVMGKPMGNGMPIAGLAARPEILEEFGNKIRYFNTFGGNSVCIAAATAVLDVMEAEGLQENARVVGQLPPRHAGGHRQGHALHRRRARRRPVRRGRLHQARYRRARRRRRAPGGQRPARTPRPHQRDGPARQHAQDPPAPPLRPAPRRPARRSPLRRHPRPPPRRLAPPPRPAKRSCVVTPAPRIPGVTTHDPLSGVYAVQPGRRPR